MASGDVRGGGTGTREIELLHPLANAARIHAVLLAGGSAFGLAAADGVMRWLERNDRGYATPGGRVPLVPAAVVYDLVTGDPTRRPGPAEGEAACEAAPAPTRRSAASARAPGAAVGKLLGRDHAVKSGVGLAATELPQGQRLAALAVVNAFGDVIGEDGQVMAGPRSEDGGFLSTTAMIRAGDFGSTGFRSGQPAGNTTLVCLMTDAAAHQAGLRHRLQDGPRRHGARRRPGALGRRRRRDLHPRERHAAEIDPMICGVIAAAITAEAIRDGVRRASGLGGIPALAELGAGA